MKAELIAVGTKSNRKNHQYQYLILSGLAELGIDVYFHTAVETMKPPTLSSRPSY